MIVALDLVGGFIEGHMMNRYLLGGTLVAATLALGGCKKPADTSSSATTTTTTTAPAAAPAMPATEPTAAPPEGANPDSSTMKSGDNQNSNVPPGAMADKPSN